jgi:type II secretory pathway predicted ATPase ExeA
MNRTPYPFHDFLRVKQSLLGALTDQHEPFALLTGDTGSGKTALLRELRGELDRARHRVLYFSEARKLGAAGLVRVLGESLRVRPSMCHAVSFERVLRALSDEPHTLLVWLDEAHDLPEETLAEARALAESDLEGVRRIQILLVGLPKLRAELQAHPALWRRIVVREELTGLLFEELAPFLDHHFSPEHNKRLCEQGLSALFERAKGVPGLLLPMYRAIVARAGSANTNIDPAYVEDTLERWDLA